MIFTRTLMTRAAPVASLVVLLLISAKSGLLVGAESIDIHFDNKESGFFLKQSSPYPPTSPVAANGAPPPNPGGGGADSEKYPPRAPGGGSSGYFTTNIADVSKGGGGGFLASKKINVLDDRVISTDRFTVFDSSAETSIAVKVNYGPFSTKQTIPSPFIVPEVPLGYFNNATNGFEEEAVSGGSKVQRLATTNSLDLSVHLVQSQVPRDNPVLRVLFHIGSSNTRRYSKQKLCIVLQVCLGAKTLTTSCSPDNEDGVCLAQVTIPSTWWTPLPHLPWKKHVKYPLRHVKVSYSVLETKLSPRVPPPPRVEESGDSRASSEESPPRRRGRSSELPPQRGSKVTKETEEERMLIDDDYVGDEGGEDGEERNGRNERENEEEGGEDDDDEEEEEEDLSASSEIPQVSTLEAHTQRTRGHDKMDSITEGNPRNRTEEPTTRRAEASTRNAISTGQENPQIERNQSNKSKPKTVESYEHVPEQQTPKIYNREMLVERTTRKQQAQQQKDQKNLHDDSLLTHSGGNFHIPPLGGNLQRNDDSLLTNSGGNFHIPPLGENLQNPPPGKSLESPPLEALEESQCLGHLSERVQIRPITALGSVPLVHARVSYKEYYLDRNLIVLISHQPLYPLSRVHIPVFVYKQNVNAFVLKCRVKSALRIISVENSNPLHWNLSADISAKSSSATVTARRIGVATDALYERDEARDPSLGEVLSFLIEVVEESSTELWDEGKLVWTVKYPPESSSRATGVIGGLQRSLAYENVFSRYGEGGVINNAASAAADKQTRFGGLPPISSPVRNARQSAVGGRNGKRRDIGGHSGEDAAKSRKVTAKFQIHKDDIYAVLPISKSWQILNTAVLSGRQISQPMKVFIVSQAGKIADVTLQSSCTSEDESVLKVSSSCSSVYVDGTEMRGSSNASILVRYDSYSGLAQFTIWMPEFPLDITVGDAKLSQIKGWKISADDIHYSTKFQKKKRSVSTISSDSAAPAVNLDEMITEDNDLKSGGVPGASGGSSGGQPSGGDCRYKYQQTQVQVYARFVAPDHDTGRTRYLVSRRTSLRITDLVASLLRPADPRIAALHNNILFGRSPGRTELQVISPVSGRIIGAREVRVTNDKVSPTHLSVKIVSGLQLSIAPDSGIENGYVAETSVTRRLTAQYQEGLLDIELSFSDNSRVSLRDIPAEDYLLIVDSLNPQVVAFAPMRPGSKHPRVIAVGEGRGELLRVAFLQPDTCRPGGPLKRTSPLLMATVKVDIDFQSLADPSSPSGGAGGPGGQKSDFVQNDGSAGKFGAVDNRVKDFKDFLLPDLKDILIGVPLKDSDRDQSVVAQRHSHHTLSINNLLGPHHPHHNANLAPLEIGMYVLLTSFCIAIIIFVLSCVMYASKFKPPPDDGSDPTVARPGAGGGGFFSFSTSSSSAPFSKPLPPYKPGPAYNQVATSEDNAHDWVWLGRTPLERTNGAPGSPMSIRKANNMNRMRLVYNPACEENTEEIASQAGSTSSGATEAAHARVIDTSTYCKRDRERCNVSPPVVPPHSHLTEADNEEEEEEELKPPVPPSRTESKHGAMSSRPHPHPHHHHHKPSRRSVHRGEAKERRRSRSRNSRKSDSGPGRSSSSDSSSDPQWKEGVPTAREKNPSARDAEMLSTGEKFPRSHEAREFFPAGDCGAGSMVEAGMGFPHGLSSGRNQVVDIGLVEAVPKYASAEVHNSADMQDDGYRPHANIIGNPLFMNALANFNIDDDLDLSDEEEELSDGTDEKFGNVVKYANIPEQMIGKPRPLEPAAGMSRATADDARSSPDGARFNMAGSPEVSRRYPPGRQLTHENSRESPERNDLPRSERSFPMEASDVSRLSANGTFSSPMSGENRLANYRISPEDDLKLADMLKRKPHRRGKKSLSSFKGGIDYDRMFDPAFSTTPIQNPSIEEFEEQGEGEDRRGGVDENLNQPDEALPEIHGNLGINNYFEIMKYFNNLKESDA